MYKAAHVMSPEKSLEKLYNGWKLNSGHIEARQCDTSILPLSYHGLPEAVTYVTA